VQNSTNAEKFGHIKAKIGCQLALLIHSEPQAMQVMPASSCCYHTFAVSINGGQHSPMKIGHAATPFRAAGILLLAVSVNKSVYCLGI
jgi:hypothetical protein